MLIVALLFVQLLAALALFPSIDLPLEKPTSAQSKSVRPARSEDASSPPASPLFVPTGLEGGGFQNTVVVSPDGRRVIVGADVAGLHRSDDGGLSFRTANRGVPSGWGMKVATVAMDPDDPDHLLAGTGFQGRQGGILESTDGGWSWSVLTEEVTFSGNNNPSVPGLPKKHPRSIGRLLAFGPAGELFAGSFDDGLMRSTDGGASWTTLGLAGQHIRGIDLAEDGSILHVSTWEEGLFVVEDPTGNGRPVPVDGGPRTAEEVAGTGSDVLVVAAGVEGVAVRDANGRWRRPFGRGTGTWTSVAQGSDGRLWAAAHNVPRGAPSIVRSDDDGASWDDVSSFDRLGLDVRATKRAWWLAKAQRGFLPDKKGFTAGQLFVSPADPDVVWLAGRSGLWVTHDGGGTWSPSVAGLSVTATDGLAVLDGSGTIAVANTDYRSIISTDGMVTVRASKVGATAGLAVGTVPDGRSERFLLSTAERDGNRDGEVWVAADPEAREWVSLGLAASTGGRRVLAIEGQAGPDGEPVIVAAVEGGGVWRRQDGRWEQVAREPMSRKQGSANAELLWLGEEVVVLLDRASGLWRSTDVGRSWKLVWDVETNTRSDNRTGFLAADADGERLYVSLRNGLYALDDPRVGTVKGGDLSPRRVAGVDDPGPVVVAGDEIVVATRQRRTNPATLLRSCDEGAAWENLADETYRGAATNPSGMVVLDDGTLVVALANNGVIRSTIAVTGDGAGTTCEGRR